MLGAELSLLLPFICLYSNNFILGDTVSGVINTGLYI